MAVITLFADCAKLGLYSQLVEHGHDRRAAAVVSPTSFAVVISVCFHAIAGAINR